MQPTLPSSSLSLWQRLFRFKQPSQPVTQPETQADPTAEELGRLSRGVRRLNLVADQQTEALQDLRGRLQGLEQSVLKTRVDHGSSAHKVFFDETLILETLDGLDKVAEAHLDDELTQTILASLKQKILAASQWDTVAKMGGSGDNLHVRVGEVVPTDQLAPGSITRILKQGYLRPDGTRLREAIVVVAGTAN